MYHHISDHELIEWCNKWDLLSKIQKRLITLLEESPRVGNYSDKELSDLINHDYKVTYWVQE